MKPHILIVGIGGRTGSMFARELGGVCRITGVGRDQEINSIKAGDIAVQAEGGDQQVLKVDVIRSSEYGSVAKVLAPDYIFVTTRNPVGEVVKNYYQPFAGSTQIPKLVLSQNGLSAIADAKKALTEIFGEATAKIDIIRVSLLNPIDARADGSRLIISYRLPIKLGFGSQGPADAAEIAGVFQKAAFKAEQFSGTQVLAMERAKLFLNLIGMASAVAGLPVGEGLADPKTFTQEILMLREYAQVVKKSKGSFATLGGYPIGQISFLLSYVPMPLLVMARKKLIAIVAKNRSNKPKDLGEIDYYNGEVVRLGKAVGVATPVNEEIVRRAKK